MITVLLVHDNSDLLETTRLYLEKMGEVRVDTVNSTKHAAEVLKNRSYDIIVSYYQIPEVNGIEFLADMSGVELLTYLKMQGLSTPFILYSRRDRDRVVIEDLNYAAEVIVPQTGRPGPLAELRDVVKQAVLRKRAERDLTLRCDMLSRILSASPLWICQVQNQALTFVSGPMARSLGYDEASLAGKQIALLFPEKKEYERAWREQALRVDDQGWGHADAVLVRKDGTPCHCHLRVHRADPSDLSRGEIVVFEDVSGRKSVEDALKESELRYRELDAGDDEPRAEDGHDRGDHLRQQGGTGILRVFRPRARREEYRRDPDPGPLPGLPRRDGARERPRPERGRVRYPDQRDGPPERGPGLGRLDKPGDP